MHLSSLSKVLVDFRNRPIISLLENLKNMNVSIISCVPQQKQYGNPNVKFDVTCSLQVLLIQPIPVRHGICLEPLTEGDSMRFLLIFS